MELIQLRGRWWEVWLLWLERLPHLRHGSQYLVAGVQEALLKIWQPQKTG